MEVKNQKLKKGRVTKVPLLIILVLCAVLLCVLFFTASGRGNDPEKDPGEKQGQSLLSDAREEIARLQARSIKKEVEPEPMAEPVQAQPAMTEAQAAARYEELYARREPEAKDPAAEMAAHRAQAFNAALSSSSALQLNFTPAFSQSSNFTAGGSALTPAQQKQLASSKAKLQELQGQGGELSAYSALDAGTDFALPYEVESVDTPFIIRQGAVVPAMLLSGINSDIPGQVTAQVTAPVYDSPRGNYELIPQGARLIGQYLSQPAYGTERVMLAFNRIIFPDGKSLTLGAMPAADSDGYAGLSADVNNHMFRLLSGAIFLGGITAMVAVTQDDAYDSDGNLTMSSAMTQAMGASLGQVLADVVERNINIAPTLEVEPGYKFNLTLVKDLRFKGPYQGFDWES